MAKPMIAEGQYPDISGISRDVRDLKLVSQAYSTSSGELNAILQYIYHSMIFLSQGKKEISTALKDIAIAEMMHLQTLGNVICALGAQPVYSAYPPAAFNFYSTKFVSYGCSLKSMIEDDICGERHAICVYEKIVPRLHGDKVKEIILRIIEDEKLHLAALAGILKEISVDKQS